MTEEKLLDNSSELETWAYVEIIGHHQVAGRVSERKVGVQVMLQIDIPDKENGFHHTEIYSPSSIFSIKPTTEAWCRSFNMRRVNYPVLPYIPEERNSRMLKIDDHENENTDDHEYNEAGVSMADYGN